MKKLAIAGILACSTTCAFAQDPAVISWTGGGLFGAFYGDSTQQLPDVIGFRFTMSEDVFVGQLGMRNTPITMTHQVGVWRASDEALIASTEVDPTDTVIGEFIYRNISVVTLEANTEYVIGATYWIGSGATYVSNPSSANYDPRMTHIGSSHPSAALLGFVMPTVTTTTNRGRFGPNFTFEPVPEPATVAVIGFGLAALAARRRRKS